jgi:tripartite-type tricarboxylate transporter receptor subunit TctC
MNGGRSPLAPGLCAFLLCAATSTHAQNAATDAAQTYPARPIRMVVSWAPGGASDLIARLVGARLGEQLGQQFVIDNRGGASGAIGTSMAAKSAADGYTLLMGGVTELVLNPQIVKVPYQTLRDFAPISPLAFGYYVLVIHPSLPARSVKALIALAKSRPGEINYASGGTGSNLSLVAELFKSRVGVNITHVPYKGGGPATVAVMAGEAQMMFAGLASPLPYLKAKRLVALAMTGEQRSPLLPDVPTFAESGVRGMDVGMFFALLAPTGTPAGVVSRLNAEVGRLAANPEFGAELNKLGFRPFTGSPEKLSAYMKDELGKWGQVVKTAGIRGQ